LGFKKYWQLNQNEMDFEEKSVNELSFNNRWNKKAGLKRPANPGEKTPFFLRQQVCSNQITGL
jgi:hypothetical protein